MPTRPVTGPEDLAKPHVPLSQRIGAGSLTLSLLIHGVILAVGVFIIVQVVPPPPEKVVDFIAPGGGPKASNNQQMKRSNIVKNNASRVAARDVVSNFTLPDPDASADMSALGALGAGGIGGLGGLGNAPVKRVGEGMGAGMGKGLQTGSGSNPFGIINPDATALVGTFYDLKQNSRRRSTDMTVEQLIETVKDFVNNGWKESELEKFYKSPQKLSQSKVYIPIMSANAAPAAFQCEKEVEPSRWVVIYRGTVTPPWTGKYSFVGAGDDIMVVRFNNVNVFDFGFLSATSGVNTCNAYDPVILPSLKGEAGQSREYVRNLGKNYAMKIPVTFYQYDTTKNWNFALGGVAKGPEFEAIAGVSYPIEILISEVPGGAFGATLMIEQSGEKYKSASTGAPILPIFRLDGGLPKVDKNADNAPPFDKKGPVWTIAKDIKKEDI